MKISRLRELTYTSHAALGFSGAAFFIVLTIATLVLFPRVAALLATSNNAAGNMTTASGIWANSAASEARQINQIARDTRSSIIAGGRLADKLTELAGTAKDQVKQVGPLLASLKASSDEAAPAIHQLGGTATAATGLLTNASSAFGQLADPQHGISPVMATYLKTGTDLNEILERKAVGQMLDNFADITKHGAAIAANGDLISGQFEAVTKKATDDYLGPHPWYTKIGRFASDSYDYGALWARHAK